MNVKLEKIYTLDYQDAVGHEPLDSMLREIIERRRMSQDTYRRLSRKEEPEIFAELDKFVTDKPSEVLFLCWW
jgi:hypothetical protein